MAKLYFRYGAMNSSKSALLQTVAWNYNERDQRVVIAKPTVDTKSPKVSSRLGIERDVDWPIAPDASFHDHFEQDGKDFTDPLCCIIVDEAQFLTPKHVDELFELAVVHNVPVVAYGLRSDFRTHSFPGALRLLELAHSIQELKTICRCGSKALFNGRKVDGDFVQEGAMVAIDGQGVEYESLCGLCYFQKVGKPAARDI